MSTPRASHGCAKFILGGEHSVVYRGRALAFPLHQCQLTIEESESTEGLYVNGEKKSETYWTQIQELRKVLGIELPCKGLSIKTQIPFGGGLGSSAALCVALCRHHHGLEGVELAKAALKGEKFFHGRPSGVDPYAVAIGKPLVFTTRDQSFRELDLSEFSRQKLCFVLKDSKLRHRTSEVVENVARTKTETPLIWEDLMDALSTNAEQMIQAFERNPSKDLGRLMNDTHFRLIQLGVSNDTLDDCVTDLKNSGALGAKLTGAGRGGYVLGLFLEKDLGNLNCDYLLWNR